MIYYKPIHFQAYELVDKELYELLGNNALRLYNQDLLKDLDSLRENLNRKITVNDWYWGGIWSQRGIRTIKSKTGESTSQHMQMNAIDFVVEGMTAKQVRKHIRDNRELYPAITRLEGKVSWVHIDGKNILPRKSIYTFYKRAA